jgi:hypothetical protein
MRILDDPNRTFVVSDFLRLEVLPQPTFHARESELEFMHEVLDHAEDVPASPQITGRALALAGRYCLAPMDAAHVAAAVSATVDELVTVEKSTHPMCMVQEVRVMSIHS